MQDMTALGAKGRLARYGKIMTPEERKERRRQQNREYRARKAAEAGRNPGKTGRPATGRKVKHRGDVEAQNERRKHRRKVARGDNGWVDNEHPIMSEAIKVADATVRKDQRTAVTDALWDDVVCEAALAIIEGRDPYEAARAYKSMQYDWSFRVRTGESDSFYEYIMEIPEGELIV